MDALIQRLGLSSIINFHELPNCRICNLDKDKILIICSITSLNDIDVVINRLPGLRKKIMAEINNKNNIAFVQNEKIPMSKFLWDMYVIGIHQVDAENKAFKSESISAYERDRFIARKIVIEYEHSDELKQKFDHYVFPERILNEFTFTDVDEDEETINYESIQALLENIEAVVKEE